MKDVFFTRRHFHILGLRSMNISRMCMKNAFFFLCCESWTINQKPSFHFTCAYSILRFFSIEIERMRSGKKYSSENMSATEIAFTCHRAFFLPTLYEFKQWYLCQISDHVHHTKSHETSTNRQWLFHHSEMEKHRTHFNSLK